MPVSLYMDHHIPKAITVGLRLRDMDVVTAHEDGADQLDDDLLLKRAHELKRALFTQDDDLLAEATKCQRDGSLFSGDLWSSTSCDDRSLYSRAGNYYKECGTGRAAKSSFIFAAIITKISCHQQEIFVCGVGRVNGLWSTVF